MLMHSKSCESTTGKKLWVDLISPWFCFPTTIVFVTSHYIVLLLILLYKICELLCRTTQPAKNKDVLQRYHFRQVKAKIPSLLVNGTELLKANKYLLWKHKEISTTLHAIQLSSPLEWQRKKQVN